MTSLSILIPHRGSPEILEETLGSVLQHRCGDCEVLILLFEPYNDPHDIEGVDGVHFLDLSGESSLMAGLNHAIERSEGDVIHLLAPGASVTEGWAEVAMGQFADPDTAVVSPQILDYDRPSLSIGLGVLYHPSGRLQHLRTERVLDDDLHLAPHASASFYRKSALRAIGGFDTSLSLRLSGVDAAITLAQAGWQVAVEPNCRILVRRGVMTTTSVFARTSEAERLFWRWAPLGGWGRTLAAHASRVAAETWSYFPSVSMLSQVLGRLSGLRAIGAHRERMQLIERIRQSRQDAAGDDVSLCFPFSQADDHSTRPRAAA